MGPRGGRKGRQGEFDNQSMHSGFQFAFLAGGLNPPLFPSLKKSGGETCSCTPPHFAARSVSVLLWLPSLDLQRQGDE